MPKLLPKLLRRLEIDGWLAVAFVGVAVYANWEAASFPGRASVWPQWISIAVGLLSLGVVLTKIMRRESTE